MGERGSWPERLLPHHYSRLISSLAHVVISYPDAIACMSFFDDRQTGMLIKVQEGGWVALQEENKKKSFWSDFGRSPLFQVDGDSGKNRQVVVACSNKDPVEVLQCLHSLGSQRIH